MATLAALGVIELEDLPHRGAMGLAALISIGRLRRDGSGLAPVVQAERAGTECNHLQKASGDCEVFHEVDHLVLVDHVVVE